MRGPGHQPRLDLLGLGEDVERGRRRVVDGRHAVGEVGEVLPLGLGEELEGRVVEMGVGVDQPGDDGLARAVEALRARRDRRRARRADRRDAVARDEDVGVLEDLVALHRDDARAAQQEGALRHRARAWRGRSRSSRPWARAPPRPSPSPRPPSPSRISAADFGRGFLLRLLLGLAPLVAREFQRARSSGSR